MTYSDLISKVSIHQFSFFALSRSCCALCSVMTPSAALKLCSVHTGSWWSQVSACHRCEHYLAEILGTRYRFGQNQSRHWIEKNGLIFNQSELEPDIQYTLSYNKANRIKLCTIYGTEMFCLLSRGLGILLTMFILLLATSIAIFLFTFNRLCFCGDCEQALLCHLPHLPPDGAQWSRRAADWLMDRAVSCIVQVLSVEPLAVDILTADGFESLVSKVAGITHLWDR